jgi:hypothetical protein
MLSDLLKPDLLTTMPIEMLEHLQKGIVHCMMTHEWLDKYNAIWLSMPDYHDLTPKTKSYEGVSQWDGKEMKEMSQYLLRVVTQSPQGGSPAKPAILNRSIECTWTLSEF